MVQVVGQEGLGELLGGSLGQGISQGIDQLTKHHLANMLSQKKEQAKQFSSYSPLDVKKDLTRANFSPDEINRLSITDLETISDNTNKKVLSGIPTEQAKFEAFKEFSNPSPEQILQKAKKEGDVQLGADYGHKALYDKSFNMFLEGESPGKVIRKGGERNISGRQAAISRGEGYKEFEERLKLKAPKPWKEFLYSLSSMAANAPYHFAGAKLGGLSGAAVGSAVPVLGTGLGATIGGSAGFLAFPAMIDQGLQEYQKYIDRGGKGTFGDFLDSVNKVAETGIQSAGEGILMQSLMALRPLKNIPGFKALFDVKGGKQAEKLGNTIINSGLFTTSKGIAEVAGGGEFPSLNEYGKDLATFLTFDLFGAAGKYKDKVYKDLKDAGISSSDAGPKIQEKAQEKGYDLNKSQDVVRVVKDITKEPSKAKEAGEKALSKIEQPKAETAPKELAERISTRPVKEYVESAEKAQKIKEKPLTEKETAKREKARREAEPIESRIQTMEKGINKLEKLAEETTNSKNREVLERTIERKKNNLSELREKSENLRSIESTGKESVTEAKLADQVSKRISEIMEATEGKSQKAAEKLDKFFKDSQKDLKKVMELSKQKDLPDSKRNDTFIKVHDAYINGYKKLLSKVKDLLKSPAHSGKRGEPLRKLEKALEKSIKVGEAKIKNHKDKWNSLNQLKGPKGALVKQYLKSMRNDIKSIQQDFIRQIKEKNNIESRVESSRERSIIQKKPDIAKIKLEAEEAAKKSEKINEKISEDDINSTAKEAEIPKEKLEEQTKKTAKEIPSIMEQIKANPNNAKRIINNLYRKMPFKYQIAVGVLINNALKQMGVPYYVRTWLVPAGTVIKLASTGIEWLGSKGFDKIKTDSYVNKLLQSDSFGERSYILKEAKKQLKPAQYKRVLLKYDENS